MTNSWRCESCLVVNTYDAIECICCMEKKNITANKQKNGTNKTSNLNLNNKIDNNINNSDKKKKNSIKKVANNEKTKNQEDGVTKNKDLKIEKNVTNSVKDTKKKEKSGINENTTKHVGFIPTTKPLDANHESSKSIFLTGITNTATNKKVNKVEKTKEKGNIEKNDKGSNKRIQPSRKCNQKKICYKT